MSNSFTQQLAFVAWDQDFPAEPLYSSKSQADGSPEVLGYLSPDLLLGSDGTLWLVKRGDAARILRIRADASADAFPLQAAGMKTLTTAAPTADAGLILFGLQPTGRALVRLSAAGEVLWQVDDLPAIAAEFDQARLLADPDGSVYLYIAVRRQGPADGGHLFEVDMENGSLTTVTEFSGWPPKDVWARDGKLFWVVYAEGVRSWVTLDTRTQKQWSVDAQAEIQPLLGSVCGPLSDGGALLATLTDTNIIWMGANGEEMARFDVAEVEPEVNIAIVKTVIGPQGAIFLVGTNARGVYVFELATILESE